MGDHSPVPCKALLDWEGEGGSSIQSKEDLDTKKLMYEITKKCPKCSSPIEKNGTAPSEGDREGSKDLERKPTLRGIRSRAEGRWEVKGRSS